MPLSPGARLGPYEIIGAIGAGGMGEVYRARDTRLGRTVAIKILSEGISTVPGFRERLAQEARAISSVEHPHICPLYDIGTEGGVDFLVMQHIEGETLAERLRRGPLAVPEALRLARQIASGLEAAHERGILHRDLKPSNIKLTPDGNARILDFGLARILETPASIGASPDASAIATALTQSGSFVGTPGYMSPDQILRGPLDKRVDVWAFGCVLFEMLSGRRAFDGETVTRMLTASVNGEPDWTALPANTPARVRALLRRCLQKDPARRLRDMGDAGLELDDARLDQESPAAAGTGRPPRRGPAIVAWIITGVIALAAAAVLLSRPGGGNGTPSGMRFSAVTTFSGVETQPSLSPDGRSVAFASNHGGQWDLYIGLVTGGDVVRLTQTPEVEAMPRWSPDGSRLLFSRVNERGLQDLWVMSALGGTPRRVVANASQPTWSPDGRSIAYASDGGIWVCDATGESPREVTRPEPPLVHNQPAFAHDGRRLAFVRRPSGPYGELAIVDLRTGEVSPVTHDTALAWSPVWSPDDRFIYFTSSRGGTVNIWKIAPGSGTPERITAGQGADMEIDLSADGTRLIYSSFRSNVNLAEVSIAPGSLGQRRWLTSDAARGEFGPRYSRDGRHIAYFSNRTGAEREAIWVVEADGSNPTKLVEDDFVSVFPRWDAGDQHLVYFAWTSPIGSAGMLRRVPLAGGAPQELPNHPFRSVWGDAAPDGRLVYQTSPTAGEVYDPGTRERRAVPDLPAEPFWSPDGGLIAYMIRPGAGKESDEGLWVGEPEGPRKQVFHGWAVWFEWAGAQELLVLEGRPDFKGVLSRIDLEGRRQVVLPEVGIFRREHEAIYSALRFGVHPDGRRIVIESLEFQEADIGMIDHVR